MFHAARVFVRCFSHSLEPHSLSLCPLTMGNTTPLSLNQHTGNHNTALGASQTELQQKVAHQQAQREARKHDSRTTTQRLEDSKRANRQRRKPSHTTTRASAPATALATAPATAQASSSDEEVPSTSTTMAGNKNSRRAAMNNPDGMARITNRQYQQLLDDKHNQSILRTKEKQRNTKLTKAIELEKKCYAKVKDEKVAMQMELESLQAKLNEALKELDKTGKVARFEQKDDIVKFVTGWVKVEAYRTHKFLETEKRQLLITKAAYTICASAFGIDNEDDPNYLIREEFHRIYLPIMKDATSKRRQYTSKKLEDTLQSKLTMTCCHAMQSCVLLLLFSSRKIQGTWSNPIPRSNESSV